MADINIGALVEEINAKLDNDGSNVESGGFLNMSRNSGNPYTPADVKFSDLVVLFNGPLASGDITLTDDFTNYSQIMIIHTTDNQASLTSTMWYSWELDYLMKSDINLVELFKNYYHKWEIYNYANGSTTKYFRYSGDNAQIKAIIGVPYNV